MDNFSIRDDRLHHALRDLRAINRYLGGYSASMAALGPYLRRNQGRGPLRVLDLGTGLADFPEYLVRWGDRRGVDVRVVGVDLNPETVAFAGRVLDGRLPADLRNRIDLQTGDALDLPFPSGAFHVATASLFLHHFPDDEAAELLRIMQSLACDGIVVNDLHRTPAAYYSIRTIAALLPVSDMCANDGPVSVLRAFQRDDLARLAERAELRDYKVHWKWAFRWTLSTL